jgi:hypothetical protein
MLCEYSLDVANTHCILWIGCDDDSRERAEYVLGILSYEIIYSVSV